MPKRPKRPIPTCSLCGKRFKTQREADDAECFGCRSHVCDTCDTNPQMGHHRVQDHRGEPHDD